eukprot:CAMPEP_0203879708 /NCGR_PEP_ID=MMETSP0359-20131031/24138_1 /ASSEMBLY_ACC=CAM_ASM_000338 /TAXON_ID=268821 /ORGANISM="Scrippsiella Hangoei, Strain SHTV-5" /LENGTH=136 /DNA_ID=CAMNT_0050799177 /DNA_START=29 /DNA_END=436 /DNA_ORIENTATION=-
MAAIQPDCSQGAVERQNSLPLALLREPTQAGAPKCVAPDVAQPLPRSVRQAATAANATLSSHMPKHAAPVTSPLPLRTSANLSLGAFSQGGSSWRSCLLWSLPQPFSDMSRQADAQPPLPSPPQRHIASRTDAARL